MSIETHFSEIRQRIQDKLKLANTEILVAMAWLTDTMLWDSLLQAQKRGVKVRVLIAKDEINTSSAIDYLALKKLGGDFYVKDMSNIGTYSKMHNKFCIIDKKTSITGSYNWTNQAPMNAENILVVNDVQAAQNFSQQFEQLCQDAITIHHLDSDLWQFKDPYQKKATRKEPTALLILLDQSGSMSSGRYTVNGETMNRAQAAAYYVNTLLDELLAKCTKDDGLRDYVDVCLLGYGADAQAAPAWCGSLSQRTWVSINELHQHASQKTQKIIRKVRGVDREIEATIRYWIEPLAKSSTPMGSALKQSFDLLEAWTKKHTSSFPPIVINITDGHATDAKSEELIALAAKIKNLQTENGRTLFFNCHLGDVGEQQYLYPQFKTDLPNSDAYAKTLFEMSSILPTAFHAEISSHTPNFDAQARYAAMFYNTDATGIARILQLGTSKI